MARGDTANSFARSPIEWRWFGSALRAAPVTRISRFRYLPYVKVRYLAEDVQRRPNAAPPDRRRCVPRRAQDEGHRSTPYSILVDAIHDLPHPEPVEGRRIFVQPHSPHYAPGGGVGIAALAASSSMSAFLDGLPMSVLGRLVRNSKIFGISIGESLSLRKARSSPSPTAAPAAGATKAFTVWPR